MTWMSTERDCVLAKALPPPEVSVLALLHVIVRIEEV